MTLTTQQVAEKLGRSVSRVRGMVRRGELAALNYNPKKKSNLKFDSKVVDEYRKANGLRRTRVAPHSVPTTPGQLMQRLDRIEAKVDQLIQMWS